jgi:hypothetical protein
MGTEMRASWLLAFPCLLSLVPLAGCSNNTGPTAAALNLSLSSPNADDGAVLLTISGGPVDSVEAVGYGVYMARPGAETVRLIVTGELASGTIARIHVPDSRQMSSYSAKILQVAARTYAQRDLVSYTASLIP